MTGSLRHEADTLSVPVQATGTDRTARASSSEGRAEDDGAQLGARSAMEAARDHLLSLQHADGWWKGELQTNVTMDVEDLLLRQFLGIRTEAETAQAARWIRSQQRSDGTWAAFHGGPGELSVTVEAYLALKLAGDDVDAEHMAGARRWILDHGGLESTRVFTRIWLGLFGEWSWSDLPAMPPEMVLLPPWFPLNTADWACWARQTIVPLTVVCTLQPQRELGTDVAELRTGTVPSRSRAPMVSWENLFNGLDRALHLYQRRPVRWLRRHAMHRAAEWIVARQEADGSWGGIQPPWVYSMLALHLLGYAVDHPVLREGLAGLERFLVREHGPDGTVRRLEACQSPVWDTVLSMQALTDAGVSGDTPALRRAAEFVCVEEIRVQGDWAVRRSAVAPSGWAFEFDNDGYPDIDDTAEVLLALSRGGFDHQNEVRTAIRRGERWLRGMQCSDGGWAAFDADNTRTLVTKLPFCDFGEVIDPPSSDVTAHVVEALCVLGNGHDSAVRKAVRWLLDHQDNDGSWFGRWGANHVYGTGAAVPALVQAGLTPSHCALRRAVRWLESHQNADGGWGEDLRSYEDPDWIGRGESTASQTAWALLALLAVGRHDTEAVRRGVDHLRTTQRADGTWDEPQFTGTGFPGDFYINYHLYRLVFPLTALGRYCRAVETGG